MPNPNSIFTTWEEKTLGEVCDFQGGSQPPKNEWKKVFADGYVRMLQIRDFTQTEKTIPEYVKISAKLKLCESTDILIGRYGASVGKILTGLSGAYNVAIIKSIPDTNVIIPEFLKYYFFGRYFQENLQKVCKTRAAQAGFSKEEIVDFKIAIPSIEEQRRIVRLLDKVFADIEKAKQNISRNIQNVKELFESELHKLFTENTGGWVEKDFEHCIKPITYTNKIQRKNFLDSGKFPIVSQEDALINGYWNEDVDVFKIDQPVVIFGDHTKKIKYVDFDFVLGADGVKILAPITEIIPKYFYYCLQSIRIRDLGYARHYRLLKEKTIKYPDLRAQKEIVAKLDALHEQTQELEQIYTQQIADLDELKQAILKKAFNGEL